MIHILFILFKKRRYVVCALLAAMAMGALSYFLMVVNVYQKSIFIYAEMNGEIFTVFSILLSFVLSIAFGAYSAVLLFRFDARKERLSRGEKKSVSSSISGGALGILGTGCPSCGAPILGLFGFPLALFSLPLKGLELKTLSIALLLASLFFLLKDIERFYHCRIKNVE